MVCFVFLNHFNLAFISTDSNVILYLSVFRKSVQKIHISLKSDKHIGT